MREANNQDDVVSARLLSVLAETDHRVRDQHPTTAAPPSPALEWQRSSGPPPDFSDTSPLKWSDIVPSWPDDIDLDPIDEPPPPIAEGAPDNPAGPEPLQSAAPSTTGVAPAEAPPAHSAPMADSAELPTVVPPGSGPPTSPEPDATLAYQGDPLTQLESESLVLEALSARTYLPGTPATPFPTPAAGASSPEPTAETSRSVARPDTSRPALGDQSGVMPHAHARAGLSEDNPSRSAPSLHQPKMAVPPTAGSRAARSWPASHTEFEAPALRSDSTEHFAEGDSPAHYATSPERRSDPDSLQRAMRENTIAAAALSGRSATPPAVPPGWPEGLTDREHSVPPRPVDSAPAWPEDSMPQWSYAADDDDGAADPVPALGTAGAFDSGRRGGKTAKAGNEGRLIAFDPGRRGVKALAAVAILVVLIAAVLAWRARPRVDPVAVPPVEVPAVSTGGSDGTAGAAPPAARPSSSGAELVVAVGGKVHKPGLVRLPPGSRVADALQAAGGANPGVDVALLNLARKVVDGELIMVGAAPPPGAAVPNGGAGAPAGGAGAPAGGPINLNTATLAELDSLPGVGPVLAQRILDAREAQGGFKAVSDLRKVSGIGDARFEQLKDLVVV